MQSKTIVTTRRLRLRTWRAMDAGPYHRHCNSSDVMDYLGGVMTPRQVKLEVRWLIRRQHRDGLSFWVMERKRDKAFLGFCGLILVNDPSSTVSGTIEIGWRLRSDMWRRGYACEAAEAVLRYGRDHVTQPIISRVAPGNVPSRGLMQKLGMRRLPELDYVDPNDNMPLVVYGF